MDNKQLLYVDKTLIFGLASVGFFCAGSVLAAVILFTEFLQVDLRWAAVSLACAVVAMICGAVAVGMGNKAVRIYNSIPEREAVQGLGKLCAGRICAVAAVALSALFLVGATLLGCVFGADSLGI